MPKGLFCNAVSGDGAMFCQLYYNKVGITQMFCALVNCRTWGAAVICCLFTSCSLLVVHFQVAAQVLVELLSIVELLLLSIEELLSIFKLLHKCLWNAGGKTQVARSRERNLGTKVRWTLAPGWFSFSDIKDKNLSQALVPYYFSPAKLVVILD